MNRIFGDRIGVDGKTRKMEEICNHLIDKIEATISENLKDKLPKLGRADETVVKDIINRLHNILIADVPSLKRYAYYFDQTHPELFYKKQNGHWSSTELGTLLLQAFNYSKFNVSSMKYN